MGSRSNSGLFRNRSAIGVLLVTAALLTAEVIGRAESPYANWSHGPSTDTGFFPLAVWLQAPANAERFRRAGFNTYIALWNGPTEEQLTALKKAGMRVVCEQNEAALRHLDDPT